MEEVEVVEEVELEEEEKEKNKSKKDGTKTKLPRSEHFTPICGLTILKRMFLIMIWKTLNLPDKVK